MENKMYTKPQYKCAICGTIHDELKARINCETTCLKKQEEEANKAAELKKKQEHDAREADVNAKVKAAIEAIKAYNNDYGFCCYNENVEDEMADTLSDLLLRYFF